MIGRDHHIHTQQRGKREDIELTLLKRSVGTAEPLTCLNEDDERTESQNGLDHADRSVGDIHATKSGSRLRRQDVHKDMSHHQGADKDIEPRP